MAKSQQTFSKRERKKKKAKKRKEKLERKLERRAETAEGLNQGPEFMYVDENGNLSTEKPDPTKVEEISIEDINVSTPKLADRVDTSVIRKGIVKFFNEEKGYGFITDQKTQESIFVHIAQLDEPLKQQNKVSFETEMGPKGKMAVNVVLIKS